MADAKPNECSFDGGYHGRRLRSIQTGREWRTEGYEWWCYKCGERQRLTEEECEAMWAASELAKPEQR